MDAHGPGPAMAGTRTAEGRGPSAAAALEPDAAAWRYAGTVVLDGDVPLPTCVCGRPVRYAHVLRREDGSAEAFVGQVCLAAAVEVLRDAGNEAAVSELLASRRELARIIKSRKDERSLRLAENLLADLQEAAAWLERAESEIERRFPPVEPAVRRGRRRAPVARRHATPKGWSAFAARLPSAPVRPSATALSSTRRRLAGWLAEAARWSSSLDIEAPPVPTDERARAMLLRLVEGGVVERGERVSANVEPAVREALVRRATEADEEA